MSIQAEKIRVGVLTGGGDCPGLNAAIRAVSKSLMLNGDTEVIGIHQGFLGLIERRSQQLTYSDCSGILDKGGTILGTSNRANPFDYSGKDVSNEVVAYYHELGLDGLIVIGGDGSLSLGYEMSNLGMNIIGIPKTIDNDLLGTDRTFGFDTAISIVTDAIDRLRTTGQSHKRVMILETMGRYTGWIALHAGIAGGADVILLPELPYQIDEVVDACHRRMSEQQFSLVVVAEGARELGSDLIVRETIENSPDPNRLGGIGNVVKMQLESASDFEVRSTILGHLQRGGSPTAFDRVFATNLGAYAASLVAKKCFGQAVVLRNDEVTHVPLESVAHKSKLVEPNTPEMKTALSMGICFGTANINEPFSKP